MKTSNKGRNQVLIIEEDLKKEPRMEEEGWLGGTNSKNSSRCNEKKIDRNIQKHSEKKPRRK